MSEQPLPPATQPAQPASPSTQPTPAPGAVNRAGHPTGPETTVWAGRAHWHHYLGRIVLGFLLSLLVVWLVGSYIKDLSGRRVALITACVVIPILVVTWGSAFYRILQKRYRLTGQRLFIERGVLSQIIDQLELIRVDDVRVHKRLTDRIFGMGTVEIRSTDATDADVRIEGIKNADAVAEQIRNSMRALRNKSLFIENL